jgi:basic membrane lipoprotein Med (substrate-binding protein (PBP1-ABC) superfamily)
MSQDVTLKGRYYATLYGPDGAVKDCRQGDNVVTTVGKEWLSSFLSSAAAAAATNTARYAAIGTDATAEAVGNTALGTELSRHTGTVSYVSGAIFQVTATFAAGSGTGAIAEYGLFTSSTGGTLISRDTESVINKGASDSLTVVYQLTLS